MQSNYITQFIPILTVLLTGNQLRASFYFSSPAGSDKTVRNYCTFFFEIVLYFPIFSSEICILALFYLIKAAYWHFRKLCIEQDFLWVLNFSCGNTRRPTGGKDRLNRPQSVKNGDSILSILHYCTIISEFSYKKTKKFNKYPRIPLFSNFLNNL